MAMPQKTEAHIMLPLPVEVADKFVDHGRQEFLGVDGDAVPVDLEVEVRSAGAPIVANAADALALVYPMGTSRACGPGASFPPQSSKEEGTAFVDDHSFL